MLPNQEIFQDKSRIGTCYEKNNVVDHVAVGDVV
jgi:hypothetical protein